MKFLSFRKRFFVFFILVLLFAAGADAGVFKATLDNGMNVIIEEEHSAPVVALQAWVRVGSADESPEEGGISHVFEHMLFKVTQKRKLGEIASAIESVGGDINAYTSFDNTVYHLVVPARHFPTGLDILSDAIQNSAFDPAELDKELEVVLEEIRMNEDSPLRTMYKTLFSTAYTTHPYRKPVIGTREVIGGLTRQDIIDFFNKWYVPNNMTFVVVGDVDTTEALGAVKEAFKDFKKAPDPHEARPVEPAQTGLRREIKSQEIKETYFAMAFHIPGVMDTDTFAIDMLASILADGVSSRLYRKLKIEEQLVHSISAYPMSLKEPGLFLINGRLDAANFERALTEILFEIKKLGQAGPDPDEMERSRTGLESGFVYSRETMEGIAMKLGYFETTAGDYLYEKKYLEGIKAVTNGDIRRMVEKYFDEQKVTVTVLHPEEEPVKDAQIESVIKGAEDRFTEFKASLTDGSVTTKLELENGITLVVKEVHANPTVAFYAAFPGGLRFEVKGTNGIGGFASSMLTRGTVTRTREELAREVEGMAGSVGGFSGRNSTGASGKFLSKHFDRGIEIFADVIKNPTFPEEEIDILREDVLAEIKAEEDNLPYYTFKLLLEKLYQKHPYGMPTIGTEDTVKGFSARDLKKYHERFFVPERMVLTVVGDVRTDYAVEKVKEVFGDFTRKAKKLPSPPTEARQTEVREAGETKEKEQTHIGIAFLGTTIGSEDSYPLAVLSEVLSGQGGRLFVNLRDKKSLAYSVSAFLRDGVDPGFFGLYIASAPEKKAEAVEGLLEELRTITTEPVTEEELHRAKNYIIGSYEIGLQDVSSQASDMANNELYGLGYDFQKKFAEKIEAVTAEDVLRVGRKYIDLDAYTISVVGPEGEEMEEIKEGE